jgi:hypothetical protein
VGNSINLGRETFRRHPCGDWEMSSEPPFFPITFNHEAVMEWALLAHALDEIELLRAEVEAWRSLDKVRPAAILDLWDGTFVAATALTGDCDGCPVPTDGCPGDCPQRVAERKKNRRDHCDSCGKRAVVTDVWIEGTPMTLCQPCVLDALTAEGESLGQYWEIEP